MKSLYGIAVFHNVGDILLCTPIARQLKADEPNCEIIWYTAEKYQFILENNPYIDQVVSFEGDPVALDACIPQLKSQQAWTQFFTPAAYMNYDKTPGGSLPELVQNSVDFNWTVPFVPVVQLSETEKQQAAAYWNALPAGKKVLVETEFGSQQTPLNQQYLDRLFEILSPIRPVFIFTAKNKPVWIDAYKAKYSNVVWCQEAFRLNAEFYNRCDAFVGVSSGISCLSNSDYCRNDVPHLEISCGYHWSNAPYPSRKKELYVSYSLTRFEEGLNWLLDRLTGSRSEPCFSPRFDLRVPAAGDKEIIPCTLCGAADYTEVRGHDIVRCKVCGNVYLRQRMNQAAMEKYYSEVYAVNQPSAASPVRVPRSREEIDILADCIGGQRRGVLAEIQSLLGIDLKGKSLIDIGCGWGPFLYHARNQGMKVMGFEFTRPNVEFGRNVLNLDIRPQQFIDANDIQENSIDFIVMNHSLEHVPYPFEFLEKIDYVLKPGGVFFCMVPNFESLCSDTMREKWAWIERDWHYTHFTPTTLKDTLAQTGFYIEKLYTTSGDYGDDTPVSVLKGIKPGLSEPEYHRMLEQLHRHGKGEQINAIAVKRGSSKGRVKISNYIAKPVAGLDLPEADSVRQIIWSRTDSIGDAILSSSMLPYIRAKYPTAEITVVCQEHIAELYESCDAVNRIVSIPTQHRWKDERQYQEFLETIRALKPDLLLNSVYTVHPEADLKGLEFIGRRVALRQSPTLNYTDIIPSAGNYKSELQRHRDFLAGLGIACDRLEPSLWITQADMDYADTVLRESGLDPKNTIAFFAGARTFHRSYDHYGQALRPFVEQRGCSVIALGGASDYAVNEAQLKSLETQTLNLCGRLTLRQSAAVLSRCRMAFGAETGLAHISAAVSIPHVILIGGGHFNRFMPYSPLTSLACLPLDCFCCDWGCRFDKTYCVKGLRPQVLAEALRQTMEKISSKIRVFIQTSLAWKQTPKLPGYGRIENFIEPSNVEIIPVESNTAVNSASQAVQPIQIAAPQTREVKNEIVKKSAMTLATSLAPKNISLQQQCVATWIEAGFDVVSVNNPDEIKELQPYFKSVRFIPAQRNGLKFYKKPLVFIDDLLEALKGTQSDVVGMVNSDIQLRISPDQKEHISQHAKDSLLCVNRTNINQADAADGSPFIYGFDAFFFHRDILSRLTPSLFCLGVTWWDYYLPLVAVLKQIPLSRLDENIAFHVNHDTNWDVEQWIRAGRYFFEKILDICKSLEGNHPLSKFSEKFKGSLDFLQKVLDKKTVQPSDMEKIYTMAEFILGFLFGNMKAAGQSISAGSIGVCNVRENRNHQNQEEDCDVSIVLATKDRAKLLDPMLSSLKAAVEGLRCEIIVIEGGSADDTVQVLRKHGVTQIYNESEHLGPGRHSWPQLYNFGFSRACGKWAMYASDDIVFGKESVRCAVEMLNKQPDDVAGGIFFYKNAKAEPGWDQFGIDFTYGPKLLMNYGLVRLDDFNRVGGLDECYKFYCADGDLCFRLYQSGKQLIPLPGCFVVHNNVLDVQKKVNVDNSGNDIELYKQKWKHFVSMETPEPRRLLWRDDMQHNTNTDKNDILGQIKKLGLWNESGSLRLHLGCGQQRLKGYVNIDYPSSEHTVQQTQAADVFADITQLDFPSQSADEIRLHHVFEHFDRPAALALLCKWHLWLKTGGRLVVETPDFDASIDLIRSGQCSYQEKQAILRHLFGSHEADWAVHKDGWYAEKFQSVLGRLGFDDIRIELTKWGVTRNITVCAVKSKVVPLSVLTDAAKQILRDSMIDQSDSEKKQWGVWCGKLDEALNKDCQAAPKPPMVSIYMSMYNTAQYLGETLDSLINQTFTDWELIIVDDGSADNSLEVARKYQTRDSRIRVSGIPHVGVVKARNEALRQCHPQAVYLMNHDSDDISLPDKLRRLVEYLDNNPEIAIVGCFAEYFGDGSVGKKPPYLEWQPQKIRQTFGEFNSMIHSASMMRHGVVRKIGCYRDNYPPAEDYEFFALALMAGFECANIPEVLHRIRLHRKSLSAVHTQVQQAHAETIKANYRQYLKTANPVPARYASSGSSLSILHTVEFYAPHTGGAEEVVQQISQRLVKRGHRVTVATTKLPQRTFGELNGVQIREFDIAGNYARGFQGRDIDQYVQFVRSGQFDVMFNYAAQQWATDLAFAGLESTATKRVNVIAPCGYSALSDAKTLRLPQYAKYFNAIIPACLPRYDAAVYHSAMYKDFQYANDHGFTNSIVIPNGTSEEEFSAPSALDFRRKYSISTKYLGLCVANFFAGKGHQTVIEAVRQMHRPDFTLVFIGKEGQHLPELQKLAAGLNIRFCVNIPRQDTVAAYQAADLFLFGSEIEASPLVIIEAKASRTPFVTTDVGNVREWKGGIVCTPEKMAYHANILLDNETMRKTLAQEGWSEWKDKLTWESVADRYEQLYLSLKNTKHKGLPNDFNHFQQRPGDAASGDNRVVSAALSGY